MIDNSGIEFFYTSTPRQHDAGILTVGHNVNRLMIVPPNTGSYYILGECPADCTTQVKQLKIFSFPKFVIQLRCTIKYNGPNLCVIEFIS